MNKAIYFGASDGFLYMVNPTDGEVIQKIELGAPIFPPITPVQGGFLMTDFGGSVYSFFVAQ